ncbi:MAG: methyl-accepting chemotaxis protein [Sulfuriflexus sp.]|nr:methyl-accepting chemotaxis protein [Sulfuriflexus sp.]
MKALFFPAIKLMDRLNYTLKFSLVITIFVLALLPMAWNIVSSINDDIAFLEKERVGLEYLVAVRNVMAEIPKHRGLTNTYLKGDKSVKSAIMKQRAVINTQLAQLEKTDSKHSDTLNITTGFATIKSQWLAIETSSTKMEAEESFTKHTELVQKIIDHMSLIADKSGLTLDPELDSFYMMNMLSKTLPSIIESMAVARGFSSGIVASGGLTPQSWAKLSNLIDRLTVSSSILTKESATILSANTELTGKISAEKNDAINSISKFNKMLKNDLLDADEVTLTANHFFSNGSQAINAVYTFYDAISPELDSIFTQRIEHDKSQRLTTILTIIAAIFITIYLFAGFYTSVQNAIRQLSDAAGKLADGDLTARADLNSKDEMSHIADVFNDMAEKFGTVIEKVQGSTSQVATASEQMSAITVQTAQGVSQQQNDTTQVATAINEMSTTVQEVASNASSAANEANNANKQANNGKNVVNETVASITSLANEIESTATVIQHLKKESEDIGSVLDVIKGIAEQTNLLALNAAIEAARAGEQGRGFAVVADEVRTLAQRTQESTQEIESMISKLQSSANEAVNSMERGRRGANDTVTKANEAGEALDSIVSAITIINDMNTQIASASEQQSAVAEEINRNINNISQISDQTAGATQQTSTSSTELAGLADELQGLVSTFRV